MRAARQKTMEIHDFTLDRNHFVVGATAGSEDNGESCCKYDEFLHPVYVHRSGRKRSLERC
jgi:hypothetical protein